ncbi:hypothetical protein ACET3Z_010862 [Daucus carota]
MCSDVEPNNIMGDKYESRLYIGNLDFRITEAALIKMFSPFGTIVSEDFLWHTRGPKRGEPRGYAFVQYRTVEEAKLAKEKVHGKLVYGRPLVVRLASEKDLVDGAGSSDKAIDAKKPGLTGSCPGQLTRSAKIAAIKNKLKDMEEQNHETKRPKKDEGS